MDTAKLKKMAQYIRKELISIVATKLETVLLPDSIERRESKNAVSALEGLIKEITKEQVVEKVAYTWFNRFCALRYMEMNKYTKINVVSPIAGQFQPEVLAEAKMGYIDDSIVPSKVIEKVRGLLNNSITSKDPQGEAYKLLIIAYCNYYNQQMSFLFEKISDYTELLMPDDLISGNSVISYIRETLTPETCSDIEVIGWLYQYYISEKKDEVFADLKKGKKISKENVPAATQIFTPKWIVSYMVENSVGKLWLVSHPDEKLQLQFKYYLASAEQESEVQEKLKELINTNLKPQDIKVLDPACGSGHILVKAFDVLFEIYKSQGWQENEIPEMILKNNLFGLDICDRAAQLAQFAIMMKARAYDRNIFKKVSDLNITSIQESNWIDSRVKECLMSGVENNLLAQSQIQLMIDTFKDAKEYGSILDVKDFDFDFWNERLNAIQSLNVGLLYTDVVQELQDKLPKLVKQAKIMQQKYECVIANPPYMGNKGMSSNLSEYVKKHYSNSKGDMFAVFKEVILKNTKANYYSATVNQHSWMFLSSYETLREWLLNNAYIDTMVHLGTRAFEEIGGEVVQTTTYVTRKIKEPNYIGKFIKLTDYPNAQLKEDKYLERNPKDMYTCKQNGFHSIQGSPIAYWVSDKMREVFNVGKLLQEYLEPKQGTSTGNNDIFLRLWQEVTFNNTTIKSKTTDNKLKWYPATKGGEYRKWYGNNEYVVNWQQNGKNIKEYSGSAVRNPNYNFREALTWSGISSRSLGIRYCPSGFVFLISGKGIFGSDKYLKYILGFSCSKVANNILKITSPTMSFEVGYIATMPVIFSKSVDKLNLIIDMVNDNIQISKDDWDSFETSWDFEQHPLLKFKENGKVQESFNKWKEYKQEQFNKLKANEEELNRLFIEIYGLQGEMDEKVDDKDITVALADEKREIKSLVSYAVGCMLGRYSLDEKGLAFAGGEFDKTKYKSFPADEDGVIPILSEHLFSDDITSRFKEFLKVAFGETYFEENLEYVASVLGKKNTETADDTIRNYFMKDFYNDHIKIYQKRPIYWMFSSPKCSFNALVYMHRYNKDTASVILNSYLRNYRDEKLKAQIENCKQIELSASTSQGDKIKASKRRDELEKIVKEVTDYERDILYPLATERKEIDLDDGVKVNYLKFGKALKDFGLKAKK